MGIAAGDGGDATVSVGAADEFNFGHDAGFILVNGFEEQPRDGSGFRGALRDNLTFDGAVIEVSPAGAGAVDSYFGAGCVEE